MMMKRYVFLLTLMASGLAAAEPLLITQFNADTIETLDAEGQLIARVPVSSLPQPTVPVVARNEELDLLKIQTSDGDFVWLDAYYVKLNQGKIVDLPCYKISETNAKDSRETGTMGFGGTCQDANE